MRLELREEVWAGVKKRKPNKKKTQRTNHKNHENHNDSFIKSLWPDLPSPGSDTALLWPTAGPLVFSSKVQLR